MGKWRLENIKPKVVGLLTLGISLTIVGFLFIFREKISEYPKAGYMGLFVSCLAANGTVFLPSPSSAIVTGFAASFSPVLTGIIGGFGAACGELTGYMAGRGSGEFITSEKYLRYVKTFYDKHGKLAVFLFALFPLPLFDIVGFNAGAAKMNILHFFLLCATGKIIKMLLYAFFGAWLYSFLKSFPLSASFMS